MTTIDTVKDDLYDLLPELVGNVSIVKEFDNSQFSSNRKLVKLYILDQEWMNSVCSEDRSHRDFCTKAYGDVLIAGLGLGGDVLLVKDNPLVDSVHVVESNLDVIDAIWDLVSNGNPTLSIYNSTIEDFLTSTQLTFDIIWCDIFIEQGYLIPEQIATFIEIALPRLNQGGQILFWKDSLEV